MEQTSQVIFDKNSIEFVTVAAEYCAFIERARGSVKKAFVDTALKILPLLYLKASLIPECEMMGEDDLEVFPKSLIASELNLPSQQESRWCRWRLKLIS